MMDGSFFTLCRLFCLGRARGHLQGIFSYLPLTENEEFPALFTGASHGRRSTCYGPRPYPAP